MYFHSRCHRLDIKQNSPISRGMIFLSLYDHACTPYGLWHFKCTATTTTTKLKMITIQVRYLFGSHVVRITKSGVTHWQWRCLVGRRIIWGENEGQKKRPVQRIWTLQDKYALLFTVADYANQISIREAGQHNEDRWVPYAERKVRGVREEKLEMKLYAYLYRW